MSELDYVCVRPRAKPLGAYNARLACPDKAETVLTQAFLEIRASRKLWQSKEQQPDGCNHTELFSYPFVRQNGGKCVLCISSSLSD